MVTKYNTGDRVLAPVTIKNAMDINGEIFYSINGNDDLLPEGIIEGHATLEKSYDLEKMKKKLLVQLKKLEEKAP